MSESGDQMETTDLTHPPGPDEQPAPTDSTDEVAPIVGAVRPRARKVEETAEDVVFDVRDLAVSYGGVRAVRKITLPIYRNEITALIGPSGCGKTTFLRCLNRMNDLIETALASRARSCTTASTCTTPAVDPVEVRRRIGMVFQKPNPFPKSIYDNIAFGPKIAGFKGNMDELVEESLRRAALWDEVKDKLKESGLALSGGQQQRLCIARAIATRPDVILMDEPCSALDPIATQRIEDLMQELLSDYTIVIVTHNMQQAARVSDRTAFFTVEVLEETGHRTGTIVEFDRDRDDLHEPERPADRGLRHGTVRMMPRPGSTRSSSAMELELLDAGRAARRRRSSARSRRSSQHDDELAPAGDRRRRRDRRALPRARPPDARAAGAAGAGRGRPSAGLGRSSTSACTWSGSATRRSTSRRCSRSRATCPRNETIRPADRRDGRTSSSRWSAPRWTRSRRRDLELCLQPAEDGRPGRPPEPEHAPRGRQARRRAAGAGVGHAHEPGRPRARARRRQRRRHRRAGRVPASRASSASSPTRPTPGASASDAT